MGAGHGGRGGGDDRVLQPGKGCSRGGASSALHVPQHPWVPPDVPPPPAPRRVP